MSQVCRATIQVCRIRAARLDTDGVPLPGANNLFVIAAPIQVGVAFEIEEGARLNVPDGCNNICLRYEGDDKVTAVTLTPQLCVLDNEFIGRLTGGTIVSVGAAVIGHYAPLISATRSKWSFEMWSRRWATSEQDTTYAYWRWGFPSTSWRMDDFTLTNEHTPIPLVGRGGENTNFYDGPAQDWTPPLSSVYGVVATNTLPNAVCGSSVLAAS